MGLASVLLFLASCGQQVEKSSRTAILPFYEEASFTPKWMHPSEEELSDFHKIRDFKLINQEGEMITQEAFKDKIYITNFFFTSCPGICPKMANHMKMLQEEFKDDDELLLLSHSVTPELDSIAVLKEYALVREIVSGKWHLATGERSEIYDLGRNAYFVEENLGKAKTIDEFLHTENFVLIDKNKHIRGIYNGLNKVSVQQLITDIKTLKKEPPTF